jgi:hypothetical protein
MRWNGFGAWALVGSLALGGCATLLTGNEKDVLVGEWEWLESTGGIAGMTTTPASTGETMTVSFGSNGVVELFRNGTRTQSGSFSVQVVEGTDEWDIVYDTPIFGWDEQRASLSLGRLVLVDPCCDGFVRTFRRIS